MKKVKNVIALLCAVTMLFGAVGFTSKAATTTETTTETDLAQQVSDLYNQINQYRQQIQILWNTIVTEADQNIANQYRAQCGACAQQIIALEAQIKQLTGMDTYWEVDIANGTKMACPTVLHTTNGDLVPVNLIPTRNLNYDWNSYTLCVVSPDTSTVHKRFKIDIIDANGSVTHTYNTYCGANSFTYYYELYYVINGCTIKLTAK